MVILTVMANVALGFFATLVVIELVLNFLGYFLGAIIEGLGDADW